MKFTYILGIRFFDGTIDELLCNSQDAGLIVVPSAPVLVNMFEDNTTKEALRNADFAIADSGLMVWLWFIRKGKWINRISGLKYLRYLIRYRHLIEKNSTFWVMPNKEDSEINVAWLKNEGIILEDNNIYIAPIYSNISIEDTILLKKINLSKPKYIILNIGGGVQEKLGYYLKKNITYKPTIICTGAAIAFLSKRQAYINPVFDAIMIGWFIRIIYKPIIFIPRYLKAIKLIYYLK